MKRGKPRRRAVEVDDADVDAMMALLLNPKHPYGVRLTPEDRADAAYDFALNYGRLCGQSVAWAKELARRVRKKLLWANPGS